MQCATGILGKIQADCKPQETIMVGTTLQNMMGAYEGVCKFESNFLPPPPPNTLIEKATNNIGNKSYLVNAPLY